MKSCQFAMLALIGLCVLRGNSWSRPVDLSAPNDGVGSANLHGYLDFWREMSGVGLQLDKDSYLPLRFKFSSDPTVSGILGSGYYMPLFEAKSVLLREKMMRSYLPCGKGLFLRRDSVDPNKFQTVDQVWTGTLKGDDFTITRDDGWAVRYNKGRLTSITTDENHVFTWLYEAGRCVGINEDDRAMLNAEYDQTGLLKAVEFGGKAYLTEYGERPQLETVLGQTAIKQLVPALTAWKYPDGKKDLFKWGLTPDRIPTFTFTDENQQSTNYTWDVATGHISSEEGPGGNWKYHVGDLSTPLGVPPITRTNSDGKTEGLSIDTKLGTYEKEALDGSAMITHVFETPGPLYNKVKSIEKISNGQTTTVYKASYDEKGRLLRKIDDKGFATVYSYDTNGNLLKTQMSPPSDPQLLEQLKHQEGALLQLIAQTADPEKKGSLLQRLAFFYIHNVGSPDKARVLLPLITNRQQSFNVHLHLIDGDITMTDQEKGQKLKDLEQQYPEQKQLLDVLSAARLAGR